MSIWSGLAAAGIAIALAVTVLGQPLWELRVDTPETTDTWSYGAFVARHTVDNKTTGNTTENRLYPYVGDLSTVQPRMAGAFAEFGQFFLLGVATAAGGIALSAVSAWKKLRGIYAGVVLLASCAAFLYAGLSLVMTIGPAGTADRLGLGGGPIPGFNGQSVSGSTTLSCTPLMGWIIVLVAGLASAWGSSDLWHVRPAKKPASGTPKVPVPKAVVRIVPPPPPPPEDLVRETPQEPAIEEVFVIASNGLLIKHMARSLMTDKDRDVVGGMISAISSFVREAFTERDGEVHEVTLGDHRFVMCSDSSLVLAVLVTAGETEDIVHRLRHLLALLKDRYSERLANWQGAPLEGIEDELSILWDPYHLPPPPAV